MSLSRRHSHLSYKSKLNLVICKLSKHGQHWGPEAPEYLKITLLQTLFTFSRQWKERVQDYNRTPDPIKRFRKWLVYAQRGWLTCLKGVWQLIAWVWLCSCSLSAHPQCVVPKLPHFDSDRVAEEGIFTLSHVFFFRCAQYKSERHKPHSKNGHIKAREREGIFFCTLDSVSGSTRAW